MVKQNLLFAVCQMECSSPAEKEESVKTPMSTKTTKKEMHLKKLHTMNINFPIENCKTFVLGISGGDCAGKREMIQYMFDQEGDDWVIRDSGEPVTILHQGYFVNVSDGRKYSSEGTNWQSFYKHLLSLLIGNEVDVAYKKGGVDMKVHLKPAKLIVIEGSHLFMSAEDTKNVSSLINLRVFIDSDADVRLSRRVYQDTELNKKSLAESVATYLEFIKPSYEREIQQTKQTSDIIIPHFGGGFKDHKKDFRQDHDSNIKNACNLIMTHLKEEMKKYEEEIQE